MSSQPSSSRDHPRRDPNRSSPTKTNPTKSSSPTKKTIPLFDRPGKKIPNPIQDQKQTEPESRAVKLPKEATYRTEKLDVKAAGRRTFRPKKSAKGTQAYKLQQFAEATLGLNALREVVKLPEGEDVNEWLACHVVDFYTHVNMLYGSITEYCSPTTCPEMKATEEFEYLWQDSSSEKYKKPTKMSAPEYIDTLMKWTQALIDNESVFPTRTNAPFPKNFAPQVRQIFKRLYRVYAHIYCHHYPVIVALGLEPHLNTSFKHYVLFIKEFELATGKDFWGPLGDLVDNVMESLKPDEEIEREKRREGRSRG
ncbi:hypothetical protein BJ508DRAFT_410827 [Ascobolus immersus RN42]|uniref:Mob1/phocein n=1 Tax=Ascobolus immersus RN42 TaxID=1160509 RepID=A0A3N4IPG9_ASCIM|nr:hypothetical protein BJ508DRAFT_410827 [Ascobolus immersus RN42]